jgi:hypothetical protein
MIAILCLLLADPADLVTALHSDDPAVRLRAVQQVERLGADGSPAEEFLLPLATLLADGDPQTRGLASLALWRHVAACKDKVPDGVVAPLLLGMHDEDVHLAAYCGRTFSALGEHAWPQVQAATAAGQPRALRLAALEGCRQLVALPTCHEHVEVIFWDLLLDADAGVRSRTLAVIKLAQIEHPLPRFRDVPRILAALHSKDEGVRALAADQLEVLTASDAPVLREALADSDKTVRAEVHKALDRLAAQAGGSPVDDLNRVLRRLLLGDLGQKAREPRKVVAHPVFQIRATGDKPTKREIADLAALLRSPSLEIAREAAATLRDGLAPPMTVPTELLDALRDAMIRDDVELRLSCTRILATYGALAELTLCELLRHPDIEVQMRAAETVALMAEVYGITLPGLESALLRLYDAPRTAVRQTAARAVQALHALSQRTPP